MNAPHTNSASSPAGTAQRWARALGFALAAALVLGWAATPGAAQTGTQHEYEIKAGVLYNILKYVEWPADASASAATTIQIGLLGQLPYAAALEVLDGKTIQGRKLVVKRIATAQQAGSCQVLFIGASERPRLAAIVAELKSRPVLTVSEVEGFAELGGMVNLVAGPNRIIMEINREVAGQARLSISSQLLKLAKVFPR